jgi:hypothetical protein
VRVWVTKQIFPADEVDVIKYDYNMILEVKPHGINKGNTAAFILRTVLARPPPPPPTPAAASVASRVRSLSLSRSTSQELPPPPPLPPSPFLVCIGDDRSDEEMFRAVHHRYDLRVSGSSSSGSGNSGTHPLGLVSPMSTLSTPHNGSGQNTPSHSRRPSALDEAFNPNTFTICVGIKPSCARFYLHDSDDVGRLLASLAATGARAPVH